MRSLITSSICRALLIFSSLVIFSFYLLVIVLLGLFLLVVLLPGAILHMTVDEYFPVPFSQSNIEKVFDSYGEISATSMSIYYNHTLVIGSIHIELTTYV